MRERVSKILGKEPQSIYLFDDEAFCKKAPGTPTTDLLNIDCICIMTRGGIYSEV